MEEYEIAIIGGGPAGMMAAIASASRKTIILEKTGELGNKLLLTGGGRCNITNNKPIKKLLNSFDEKNFLKHSFYTLTNEKLLKLFEDKGLDFIEEDKNRVFPKTESAQSVLDVLKEYLSDVKIEYNYDVYDIKKVEKSFIINNDIKAEKVIIATGGITYPHTGSNGAGYGLTSQSISKIKYGLVPLSTDDSFEDYAGITLYDVSINYKDKKSQGNVLLTHSGISGPAILDISNEISKDLDYDLSNEYDIDFEDVEISIDLLPDMNREELSEKFLKDFQKKGKLYLKNYLKLYLTNSFIPFFLPHVGLDGEVKLSNITKKDKFNLIEGLKSLNIKIKGFITPLSKITIGGIKIESINSKTMESLEIPNLYFAGEILEPVGPSGGYNLKIAFSTGYLAGFSASRN